MASLETFFCLDVFVVHSQRSLQESLAGDTKYKWQRPLQEAQSIRVGGGKGPQESSALWKYSKMPRGDPLIRLDPKMLIQFSCFWCFGPCVGEIFFDIKRFQSQL